MYEGRWCDGMKAGRGVYYWLNGALWEGTFKEDELHGYGIWRR